MEHIIVKSTFQCTLDKLCTVFPAAILAILAFVHLEFYVGKMDMRTRLRC